jgi:uncharacterized protein (DUF2252 family)
LQSALRPTAIILPYRICEKSTLNIVGRIAMTKTPSRTLAARYAQGVKLRQKSSRQSHADLLGPADRDPVAILAAGDRTRIPRLIPVRYERMLASPFAFLRGAAAVMAQDLRHQSSVGLTVQACGDCHLMNFGAFATPEENILFDINDFDETLPGVDFTIDLKRLAASVAVAALAEGFSKKRARATAAATVEAYRTRMRALAKLSPMEIWHSRIDLAREVKSIEDRSLRRKLHAILTKAGKRLEQDDNFPHLVTSGRGRIADKPPLIYHLIQKGDVKHRINAERMFTSYQTRLPPERLRLYERYAMKDLAFKAVGVGSVGTFCAVGLFISADGDPLFLQIKEAGKSVLECLGPKFSGHPGRRVVEGQHIMQASSDIFLGWSQDDASGRHFYVRELKNRRLGAISELIEENALVNYAHLCGRTLARAHARSADPAVLAGYMGKSRAFDDALASFAMAYADRTQRDYDQLAKSKRGIAKTLAA